ncbi:hypothetical protein BCR42DRAFT_406844 [Absidia repens]|uniref:RING-type domain-containing protein n=1 Tax=Absidia repens TaxID=90262 RepID=A0A1X2IRE6_9FUNG|nr:hypothetical protein BCR42DRAFT_406844 [Absidia repens]
MIYYTKSILFTKLLLLSMICSFYLVEASVRIMSTNETLMAQEADFGPNISKYGILGHAYEPTEDPMGCQIVGAPDTHWIALVKRGGCSFYHKAQYMQKSGAIAVIVGDEDNAEWITMYSEEDTSDIKIPSVFLTRNEYQKITNAQQHHSRPLLVLLQNEETLPWSTMDCFYIIMTICPILLFTLGWVFTRLRSQCKASSSPAFYVYQHHWQEQQQLPHYQTTTTINEQDLERCFPRQSIAINMDLTTYDGEMECPICLDHVDQSVEYRVLPCRHTFHTSCIDPWLINYKSTCPVCSKETFHTQQQ